MTLYDYQIIPTHLQPNGQAHCGLINSVVAGRRLHDSTTKASCRKLTERCRGYNRSCGSQTSNEVLQLL